MVRGRISRLSVRDVRFPTSLGGHGSDAMHTDPDYSAAYVIIETDAEDGLKGCGLTFTLGKGTEVVVCAVTALTHHVINKDLRDIVSDFRGFYRRLTSDGQLRWIGPEKGVVHLATAAILNAVWDLWAKQEGKPLWKLLVDMDPRTLVSCIDFRYITDVLTEEDAYEILQKGQVGKKEREEQMQTHGYPAYTTSCAWLGYSDDMLKQLCTEALKDGWTSCHIWEEPAQGRIQAGAVVSGDSEKAAERCQGSPSARNLASGAYGQSPSLPRRERNSGNTRLCLEQQPMLLSRADAQEDRLVHEKANAGLPLMVSPLSPPSAHTQASNTISEDRVTGYGCTALWRGQRGTALPMRGLSLQMMDANQRWDVPEAVEWTSRLAEFKPLWIEEPTSPDDILGHAAISKALAPLGIGVATGEQCHNRVIFKQLLQAKALQFLQIDSCRLGSVNENLSVLLMAKKFEIPVCPHAGGVGLCELVQHLIIFDYISVSASLKNRMCEYVDHLHEHFKYPVVIQQASYMPPKEAGYSTEMKEESVQKHQYPDGEVWKKLLASQEN
ncbi:mitochondrial enolase superfamily member 1 [Carlito syrichta]|uniref:L-fuconate dehydratase n=1 Tax=Carlito syrichta TaxID=1868482 RepID=A0A1U7UWY9_CARSF|nr:mitochondrial enolase superfamily member 1 [Carlito syrichta]